MTNPTDRAIVKQGWIQSACAVGVILGGGLLAFSSLSAKADVAVEKANDAAAQAAEAKSDVARTREEFIKAMGAIGADVAVMRAVLEERLPKKGP